MNHLEYKKKGSGRPVKHVIYLFCRIAWNIRIQILTICSNKSAVQLKS